MINEFKFGYNAAPTTIGATTQPASRTLTLSLTGTVANTGIAGQGVEHRPGIARRPRPRQQRRQRPRRSLRSVLADVRRHGQPFDAATTS